MRRKRRNGFVAKSLAEAQRLATLLRLVVLRERNRRYREREFVFVVARVLGNDLPPRHDEGQMLSNLRFILDHEPEFGQTCKLFVLNRIRDPGAQFEAKSMIEARGHMTVSIAFDSSQYALTDWDTEAFGGTEYFVSEEFLRLSESRQKKARVWACAPKVRYAMNVNGARNAALDFGKPRAEWTIVLDGNCILTRASFEKLRTACLRWPSLPYVVVPMDRISDNGVYWRSEPRTRTGDEPQLAIHHSAHARFDERFPYGVRDKTHLLKSLGIPGPWFTWEQPFWMTNDDLRLRERHRYRFSRGAVFRLSSGAAGLENSDAHARRNLARYDAILSTVAELNAAFGTPRPELERVIIGDAVSVSV
jgi:hypothetical protein